MYMFTDIAAYSRGLDPSIVRNIILAVIAVVIRATFLLTMQRALAKCSQQARRMSPKTMWFGIIPVFHLIWNFVIVFAMSTTLEKEYKKRSIPHPPKPARNIGLIWSVLMVFGLVSFSGVRFLVITGIIIFILAIIMFIVYWAKVAMFASKLNHQEEVPEEKQKAGQTSGEERQ